MKLEELFGIDEYAEGKRAGGVKVWQIQWADNNDNHPQFIFARNRFDAMNKFSNRFTEGNAQIESVREADWNDVKEKFNV